ncbi:hypothetical protein GU243_09300 [Pseudarthrobacter psychrotolerans]|uniref:Glycosyltransferase RgtA/B/C/D-like domain-containing protein n=1 Tax=Pseudarthrobacter psychrotolerans TaxID=2697569 RepID=A0A6P1NM63_9MICC|nr:hypothetical protein [Pseudarthrobacter psychrotolerans]QHK19897.1 hypothetical protein GU243_09300 [Pseudarthrobacter psychrotolerans]
MVASAVGYWCFHVLPLATSRDFGWTNFRNYFDHDQYSYLAIAVNVSNGNLNNVEPFTETGTSHYPRLYYVALGLIARVLNADIIATWQVVGIVFQLAMALTISWLLIRLTNRALLGIFGFVPSLVGVLAAPISGSWFHPLDNHGVLWGPFGTMFTLNGEAAGMAIAIMAACLIIGVTFPRRGVGRSERQYPKAAIVVGACVAVGMLANVQTYSFLTAVYFLAYTAAAFGLTTFGNRKHALISGALLVAVLLGGTSISGAVGPLAALVTGLAGAVPGVFLLLKPYPGVVWTSAVGMSVAAAPTILATLSGIAQHDDFLEYRALSSENLGVPFPLGIVGAAVPALFLGAIFWAGIKHKNKAWQSLSIGIAVAWPVIATNDLWGANQEPYRFWLDSFILATALSFPVLAQVLLSVANGARSQPPAEAPVPARQPEVSIGDGSDTMKGCQPYHMTRPRLLEKMGGHLLWAVLACSLLDYVGFAIFVHNQGTATFDDAQALAISKTVESMPDSGAGLVLSDPCIDPFRLKTLSGVPTAYYNLGLAWPTNEPTFRALLEERDSGSLDQRLAERAGVDYVMIDSGCEANWQDQVSGSKVAESVYDNGVGTAAITVWKIDR